MALQKGDRVNFKTLLRAAKQGQLALVESTDAATGEYRALICALYQDKEGMINVVPFGHMATGNPYEQYGDPVMDA